MRRFPFGVTGVDAQGLRRLLPMVKPYRRALALALLSLLAAAACGLALPQLLRLLIDAGLVQRDGRRLNQVMLLLVAVFLGQVLFGFLRTYVLSTTGERVVADIRLELSRNLLRQSASFFTTRSVGELTSRVASDVAMLSYALTGLFAELVRQTLVLTGSIVIIATMNLRLTLVMLSIVPVVVVAALMMYGGYLRRVSSAVQDSLAEAGGVLESALSGVRVVQSFVREEFEQQRYRVRIERAVTLAARRTLMVSTFSAFSLLLVFLGLAAVLWVGSRMVLAGELTTGGLSAFILYMFVVAFTVSGIVDLYSTFQTALGSAQRVLELLDARPDVEDPANPVVPGRIAGLVQLDRVSVRYSAEGPNVLNDVTLQASPGEIIALVGPSGAGKTTLILLLMRLYDATSGTVRIDGHDVRSMALHDLRRAIGMVPQETQLFAGTIRDNIAYGDLEATPAAIEAAARAANAHDFIEALPGGYDAVVGQRGMTLSGGQRQRIAIARALLKNPAILVMDEATSALDSESERVVQEAMDVAMQGRTTFVIAHRLATVRRASKIVVLDRGTVVEVGTHEALLANDGLYRKLNDLQFREVASAPGDTADAVE